MGLFDRFAQNLDLNSLPKAPATGQVIVNIINDVLVVLGIVAVLMVVVGGIRYATSQGNPDQTAKAKDTILYSIIGLIVAISAYGIMDFVTGRIGG